MPPEQSQSIVDQLPPEIAPYVLVALIVWWLTRATYKDQTQLLDRYEMRLDQLERSHEGLARELEQARAAEERCLERMESMEARYEERISELEREIEGLRSERSEPMPA